MQFFLSLLLLVADPTWQDEVKQIDRQIEELKDLQDKYRSRVQRNVNNAMRWQFQNENYLDARRAWDQASQDKQKIQEIGDQIEDLQNYRAELLKEHGQKDGTP